MSKSSPQPLIEFNPKLPKLSKNERQVLELLVEAVRLVTPIYRLQENSLFPGANFFPHDASKEEISQAAAKNPQILSPYTVVERADGGLVAIPYHIKYATLLKNVADKLIKASIVANNKEFKRFLKAQAQALIKGEYQKVVVTRLKMKPYILDIFIAPIDYFDDHLFYTKTSFQAWVGVIEQEGTDRLNNYKSVILSSKRRAFVPTERIDNYNKVKARVIDVLVFSGLIARTKFVGVNYPVDVNIVEKYGSEITLFNHLNDLRIQEQIIPTFNNIFSKGFKGGYSTEDLRRGNLRYIAMHELSHSYLYYRHASENLKDLFSPLYELAATVLGFRMGGALLLKDRITEKQLESMIVVFLCRNFYLINKKGIDKPMTEYIIGAYIFVNFLLEAGALKDSKGTMVLNFTKVFVALQDLFRVLERLLSMGTRRDAEIFIKRYVKEFYKSSPKLQYLASESIIRG